MKYSVLGILHYKDLHGYRIREHLERHFGFVWSINPGQIYPVLKSLVDEGLIAIVGINQNENKGPYRKLYTITEAGRAEFQRWLKESPKKTMVVRDPFLTRFIFFGYGDIENSLKLINEQIAIYEEQLIYRKANLPRWSKQSQYPRMIAELGLSLNTMYLEWLKRAREEIAGHKSELPGAQG